MQREMLSAQLGDKLSSSLRVWATGIYGERNLRSYQSVLSNTLAARLHGYLTMNVKPVLEERGLKVISDERAMVLVKKVLANTSDLHGRLLKAADRVLTADGEWGLDALLDNQDVVVDSLLSAAMDDYEQESFSDSASDPDSGWTGRRAWVVNSDNSRHPELDGEEAEEGEMFTMPDGAQFWGPRDDPADAPNSSNCQCSLVFEYVDKNGESSWE